MAEKRNLMTREGLVKLEEELDNLKVVARKEIAEKIKEAREQGDLSENAEYDAAKEEQRQIESRIEELEAILRNAEVADEAPADGSGRIGIGCRVVVYSFDLDKELDYKIVGSSEASILAGKISNESPIGKQLVGKKAGETVVVELPNGGTTKYEIRLVER